MSEEEDPLSWLSLGALLGKWTASLDLNLALGVDVIEKRVATGSPKFMERYRAFGPMVAQGGSAGKS